MEYQKIANLLGTTLDEIPRFITKKWVEVHDQSGGNLNVNKEIRIKTSMLRPDLCNFNNAYIVVKGNTTVTKKCLLLMTLNHPIIQQLMLMLLIMQIIMRLVKEKLVFKNNAPFINCTSKINGVKNDNAEDLDVVMPMYNLLEYSKNYRKTTGSLWNYYRDEPNNPPLNNYNADPITNSESFKYKSGITGKTSDENQENGENTKQGNSKTKKLLFH